jgi:hypothetical protein
LSMSVREVIRLTNILNRTKKRRVKLKLSKRISDGTFDYFLQWSGSDHEQDKVPSGTRLPDSLELARRFGNEK